jgi:hypothetical protein
MADILDTAGKVAGMTGIRANIDELYLTTNVGGVIAQASISTPTSAFSISASGTLSNTAAIDFTIASGDVGDTAAQIHFVDSSTDVLMIVDLDDTVLLTTAGTATLAIGDLTAVL